MKHLFFIGNKRCGTTLMVNLLNLHPNVFVSHESDVIWILHQLDIPVLPQQYEWDGWLGMSLTLEKCKHILRHLYAPVDAFQLVTAYLMKYGSEIQAQYDKSGLLWMGDKKPVQCCDPEVRPFLDKHFPDAHYIHMVRNPIACVASKMAAADRAIREGDTRGLPNYWRGSPKDTLGRWAIHENWALQVEKEHPTHRIRLEDLCRAPVSYVYDIFRSLGLDVPTSVLTVLGDYAACINSDPNEKYAGVDYEWLRQMIRVQPDVMALAKRYGHEI